MTAPTAHYCKHCDTSFSVQLPLAYTGDALLQCPACGWQHSRQFVAGEAVSCEPPFGKPLKLKGLL